MSSKAEKAVALHDRGYNCAQAVACAFCEDFGIENEQMFQIAEGFGFGMGMMDMCGAVTGMIMVIGMENSIGDLEKGKATKGDTYKKVKEYVQKFKETNGAYYCRELKAKIDGKPMCSCETCIAVAAELAEQFLKENKKTDTI
ncbi:MAG: C-GCAxxG-C-C family protein [Schaedlerella sp.]|nr:C-GCAxxG-C-C family protein [Lachnospiraceae bacterium]MDY4202372.1 C-GCAxxG-C-C family protein [Schaedlerella sp.]